jgi:hypothetical protein
LDDKFRLKVAERKVKEEDSQTLNKEIPKKTDKVEVDQTITLEEGSKMNSNKKIKKRNLDKRRKA